MSRMQCLIECFIQPFIIQTATQWLKLIAKLACVRRHDVGCKCLLVLPDFHDRTMVLPIALLQHLKAPIACLGAAHLGELLQQRQSLILGRRNSIGVGHDVYRASSASGSASEVASGRVPLRTPVAFTYIRNV
jgi:hypothetical protein